MVYGAGLGLGALQCACVGLGPRTFQGYFSKLRAAHANANTMDALGSPNIEKHGVRFWGPDAEAQSAVNSLYLGLEV